MRIKKASQAMGMMKNVWEDCFVDKETKYLFFLAIPINLLLWGCETWALKAESIRRPDVFLHRSVRRILRIKMKQVREEKIINKKNQSRLTWNRRVRTNTDEDICNCPNRIAYLP